MIKKITQNAIVDILALITFLPMALSGLILFLYWPTGSRGFQGGRNILYSGDAIGLSHQNWVNIHNLSSLLFTILIVIHLILHWYFFRTMKKSFIRADSDSVKGSV